jgi:hypothetical protein
MESQFNNLLAVVMGIHSHGTDRFREVIESRLQKISQVEDPYIAEAAAAYKEPTPLYDEILADLEQDLKGGNWSEPEYYRKRRAAQCDAKAVDWLIHMNRYVRRAWPESSHSILYLSSAQKTRRIFSIPSVRRMVEREFSSLRLPLYRSRAQMLAMIISTESGGPVATVNNLRNIRKIVKLRPALQQQPANCEVCVLSGGTPRDCTHFPVCEKIKKLEARREAIQNLGLLGSIETYGELLKARPKDPSHREYLSYFKQILETEKIGDLAIVRMKATLNLALAEARLEPQQELPDATVNTRSSSYFLPVPPRVPVGEYRAIVERIFSYPTLADRIQAKTLMMDALKEFDKLDRRTERTDANHELVRCVVYMAEREISSDPARCDANALQYAKKMAIEHPKLRAEFDCIATWSARRLEKYQEGHNVIKEALADFPEDARFHHGRSVNTIKWLSDEKQHRFCPLKITDALTDAERAYDLYSRNAREHGIPMAIQLNNIAMLASENSENANFNLGKARAKLDQLKRLLPESEWLPEFPAFFHTDANVKYEEFKALRQRGVDFEAQMQALEGAAASLDLAGGADNHSEFRKRIERDLKHLKASSERRRASSVRRT